MPHVAVTSRWVLVQLGHETLGSMSKRDIVLTNVTVVQLLRQPCPGEENAETPLGRGSEGSRGAGIAGSEPPSETVPARDWNRRQAKGCRWRAGGRCSSIRSRFPPSL